MNGPADSHVLLLLEDDDLDAELIVERLRAGGLPFELRRARTKAEYLEQLEDGGVELVLSDFSLPGYDGFAALSAVRARTPAAPFIFVSGAIGEERAIDSMHRGATDYVLKHRLERLVPAVRRALAEAELRREREAAESEREAAEAERDRLLESESKARQAAETAGRLKDEFLAIVSHELRTPLQSILGWADLLTSGVTDAATRERGLATILRNAQVQCRLIDDILDLSRITTGKLHLQVEPVSVRSFVLAAVDALRPAANAKDLTLEVELDAALGELQADAARLQQAVWNLVSNAVKFTPCGGRVRVTAQRSVNEITVRVQDTGEGLDPELLPFIFERFRQGDGSKTRSHGGLGLGLAIVRHLAELHGGQVVAESAGRGAGSTFTLVLPARGAERPSAEAPCAARPAVLPSSEPLPRLLSGVRVLVVDDEPDALGLTSEILSACGAIVTTAESAKAALRAFHACRPDVVVSDIGMPEDDGYGFLRHLRALTTEQGGATPAIALTAYAQAKDGEEATRAGYQLHLAKPVAPRALVEAVAGVVGPRASATGLV